MRTHRYLVSWFVALSVLIFAPLCGFAQNAFAQNSSAQEAFELSKSAMDDYDFFEFESADEKLTQATQIIENLNVKSPNAASVYIAQAVVGYGRFKDSAPQIAHDRAFSAFLKALTIDPNAQIPADYSAPDLDDILQEAKQAIQNTPKTNLSVIANIKPVVEHSAVGTSQRCEPISIMANVPAHPDIYRVLLYYAPDDQPFASLEMHPDAVSSDAFVGNIPSNATQNTRVRYYINAVDRNGTTVAAVGTPIKPLNTMLSGECAARPAEEVALDYGDPIFQWTIKVGTGLAFVEGNTYTQPNGNSGTYNGVSFGTAIMPVHLRTDFMFNLPQHFQLGIYIRGQLANIVDMKSENTTDEDAGVWGNLMFGVALRYFILHYQPYRLYVGIEGGYGGANATVNTGVNDFNAIYLVRGPGHIAPQIGFLWSFHKNVGLALDLTVPIHFPEKVNAHIDFSAGIFCQF